MNLKQKALKKVILKHSTTIRRGDKSSGKMHKFLTGIGSDKTVHFKLRRGDIHGFAPYSIKNAKAKDKYKRAYEKFGRVEKKYPNWTWRSEAPIKYFDESNLKKRYPGIFK